MDREKIIKIIQSNIDVYECYDYYVANEIIKDLLSMLNIKPNEIDFTPSPNVIEHVYTYDLFEYPILERKEDTLVLLVLEPYYWFDYYKDEDEIEIIKELPKEYDKNETYYADDNPVNINDKFIYDKELYIVDKYIYHDMSIVASKVRSVIEISTKDLTYDFNCGVYYFSYEDYQYKLEKDE